MRAVLSQPAPAVRVSSMQVRGLSEAVAEAGLSARTFHTRTRLDVARLADAQGWFGLEEFDALMVAASELTQDPAFGLHWGERSPMMQLDLVPTLIATAPTLRGAIGEVLQLQPLLASREEFRFRETGDRAVFAVEALARSELGVRTRSELVIAGLVRLLRYLGESESIQRVGFAYAPPPTRGEYERMFGALLHFDQPETCIEFARSALDRPHSHRNAELHQALRERVGQLRQRALRQLSYGQQLEQQVRGSLPRLPSIAQAARALAMSERSLRRRLSDEGLSYRELVDRVQRQLAEEQLELGMKSVKEIAHALGFESVSGFQRAYRRWTGDSPARARSPRARTG